MWSNVLKTVLKIHFKGESLTTSSWHCASAGNVSGGVPHDVHPSSVMKILAHQNYRYLLKFVLPEYRPALNIMQVIPKNVHTVKRNCSSDIATKAACKNFKRMLMFRNCLISLLLVIPAPPMTPICK